MDAPLIEFPADDPDRARRFWSGAARGRAGAAGRGPGLGLGVASPAACALGVHERGRGPGDTASLPYFSVGDMEAALERVRDHGGSVIHPGERWSICRDSEGSPFALASDPRGEARQGEM